MKHTLSIFVNNHPGVMSHVSGLFARRGYNINSIAVGETDDPEISSMTIVLKGNDTVIEQVKNQLRKLPDVLQITDIPYTSSITRELLLILVATTDDNRQEAISICDVFKANILDMTEENLMAEFSGNAREVNAFIRMMKKFGILEITRTGQIALNCRSTR
ncbi:MAG: acetolactate synthase small subunit [Spirochaetota bacterium]